MGNETLIYASGGLIWAWGVAHLLSTAKIVAGFGSISVDNERILTMEWIAEGITLAFLGFLTIALAVVTDASDATAMLVWRSTAMMLILMAGISAVTGARTHSVPMKLCPVVKALAAALLIAGTM